MFLASYILSTKNPRAEIPAIDALLDEGFNPRIVYGPDCREPGWEDECRVAHGSFEKLKPGEICCAEGHYRILEKFLESSYTHALVLEDDAIVDGSIMDAIRACRPFDFLHLVNRQYLHAAEDFVNHYRDVFDPEKQFFQVKLLPWSTVAYCLSRNAAAFYLKMGLPIRTQVDALFKYQAGNIAGRVFVMRSPPVSYRRDIPSLING